MKIFHHFYIAISIFVAGFALAGDAQETKDYIWPLTGVVTAEYEGADGDDHDGIDIACLRGREIKAAADGVVVKSKKNRRLGYYVRIDHLDGYHTVYGHASKLSVVKGDKVIQGQTIMLCGNTGYSTGPHLHLEVIKNGEKIDPRSLIPGNP